MGIKGSSSAKKNCVVDGYIGSSYVYSWSEEYSCGTIFIFLRWEPTGQDSMAEGGGGKREGELRVRVAAA